MRDILCWLDSELYILSLIKLTVSKIGPKLKKFLYVGDPICRILVMSHTKTLSILVERPETRLGERSLESELHLQSF